MSWKNKETGGQTEKRAFVFHQMIKVRIKKLPCITLDTCNISGLTYGQQREEKPDGGGNPTVQIDVLAFGNLTQTRPLRSP